MSPPPQPKLPYVPLLGSLAALMIVFASSSAHASCNVIPGVTNEFRGALGTLNRPFAIPNDEGEQITIRLKPMECDTGSLGFVDLPGGAIPEDDYFLTVLFEPPDPTVAEDALGFFALDRLPEIFGLLVKILQPIHLQQNQGSLLKSF